MAAVSKMKKQNDPVSVPNLSQTMPTTNFDTVKKIPASEMSSAATPASTPWVVSRMPK